MSKFLSVLVLLSTITTTNAFAGSGDKYVISQTTYDKVGNKSVIEAKGRHLVIVLDEEMVAALESVSKEDASYVFAGDVEKNEACINQTCVIVGVHEIIGNLFGK